LARLLALSFPDELRFEDCPESGDELLEELMQNPDVSTLTNGVQLV
jgi:hypothetical protein